MSEDTDTDLRAKQLELELKLQNNESEFNKQRSKFKSILLTQESELKLQQDKMDALHAENVAYQQQLEILEREHRESLEMLKLSQSMDQQEYERLKGALEQEQASLRQSFHLQLQEYQAQLQLMNLQRAKWLSERNSLVREVNKLKAELEGVRGQGKASSLEDEMNRAQEESSKLKNVVLPLETEIASLKRQLEEVKSGHTRVASAPRTQQTDLIIFDTDPPRQPTSPQDSFLSTILSTEDIEPVTSSNEGVKRSEDVFDPIFDTSSSIGVVQQILDISQSSSETDSRREGEERMRGLEGEVRDCQMRCAKYEGLLDEVRADKEELMDKNSSLTHHLSQISRDMNRYRTVAAKLRELLVTVSTDSLSQRPEQFPHSDWNLLQEYLASDPPSTPGATGGESLLTLSPVKFSMWGDTGGGEEEEERRKEEKRTSEKMEELEKQNRSLEEEVSSLRATRSSGHLDPSQTQRQMTFLKVTVDQQKQSLNKERKLRAELKKESSQQLSNVRSLEEVYADKETEISSLLSEVREELSVAKRDAQQQVAALMDDRDKLLTRIRDIEGGYTSLESQREGELKGYSVQLNEEKFKKSEAECNVAALSDQLTSVQEAKLKQHSEFAGKLSQKTDQLSQLQSDKQKMERSYSEEVSVLNKQLTELTQTRKQLEIVQKTKEELLKENQRLEGELSNLEAEKHRLREERESERRLMEEKEAAFVRLKTELNTNEEVQRDFVRLSQQLQKQVAELEDDRKLLLWDFEDDTPQCRKCSQAFGKSRRKHRCKRCCLLFCSECSQWTAETPQHKQAHVCESCFILIDQPTMVASLSKKRATSVPQGQEQSKS